MLQYRTWKKIITIIITWTPTAPEKKKSLPLKQDMTVYCMIKSHQVTTRWKNVSTWQKNENVSVLRDQFPRYVLILLSGSETLIVLRMRTLSQNHDTHLWRYQVRIVRKASEIESQCQQVIIMRNLMFQTKLQNFHRNKQQTYFGFVLFQKTACLSAVERETHSRTSTTKPISTEPISTARSFTSVGPQSLPGALRGLLSAVLSSLQWGTQTGPAQLNSAVRGKRAASHGFRLRKLHAPPQPSETRSASERDSPRSSA